MLKKLFLKSILASAVLSVFCSALAADTLSVCINNHRYNTVGVMTVNGIIIDVGRHRKFENIPENFALKIATRMCSGGLFVQHCHWNNRGTFYVVSAHGLISKKTITTHHTLEAVDSNFGSSIKQRKSWKC